MTSSGQEPSSTSPTPGATPGESVVVEQRPDVVILRVQAKSLDEEHVKKLQTEVRAAGAQAGGLPVLIDLSLVRLLPSLTLGALVRMHSESRARQQRLVLCGMQPMVRQVMSITKLDRLLEVQDDLDAALKAVCP